MKKKKVGKKILTVLMALAIIFTSIPLGYVTGIAGTADAGSGGYKGELSQVNLSNYAFKSSKILQIWYADYRHDDLKVLTSPETGNLHKFEISGFQVFCMEHGVHQDANAKLTARPYKTSNMWDCYEGHGSEYAIDNIFKILFYGPVKGSTGSELVNELGFKDSKYYGEHGTSYTLGDWTAATQMLVWESQQLMRDEDFNRQSNGLHYAKAFVNGSGESTGVAIEKNHYTNVLSGTPAIDIYNFIASKVKEDSSLDRALASKNENKPKELSIPEDATFPYTFEVKTSGSAAGEYKAVDENGKKVKGITIKYDKTGRKYTITVKNESVLDKTWEIKHNDGAAERAEKYLDKSKMYERYVWEYETSGSHTQAFVSGLEDPAPGFFKLKKGEVTETEEPGECIPPEVEVFPTIYMPIEKIDANTGFDGDTHTPMGDAGLDATFTLERQIAGGAWEVIDTQTLDDNGSEFIFQDQPFASASDLEAYMTTTQTEEHMEGDPPTRHCGNKEKTRTWDVTVNYRITETRPDGRYIDPDQFEGVREYSFNYHAFAEDGCSYECESLPWSEVEYIFSYGPTSGAGQTHVEGPSAEPAEELTCDPETYVDDVFRGELFLVKSNETENPFKDAVTGGADSNMSKQTKWTVRIKSKSFEGQEYVHLVSETPTAAADGTNIYTVSRAPGVVNNEEHPMVVGSNGSLILKDLPYGEYIVTEVGTDDPMYVPEQFIVVVSEHNGGITTDAPEFGSLGSVPAQGTFDGYTQAGTNAIGSAANGTGDYFNNRYQANVRDKIKTNVIQLQKVDSETGKIVQLEGTRVYIRYKGNPDLTEEENKKLFGPNGTKAKNIYNRFLPNAENINSTSTNYTFELDENGKLTIPYQLPYGRYEICEWLLPEGYYVGKYGEDGAGQNHDFGMIDEGDFILGDLDGDHSLTGTVAIYDKNGKRVTYQEKDQYSFDDLKNMVVNTYTFEVTRQEMHEDGNFTELVTFDGLRRDADPTYDKGDFPYTNDYKVAGVINNHVKAKITVEKLGEELVGWEKVKKDGYEVLKPVFETVSRLKDAVFGIFAAEDENLNDGSEGPGIYHADTDEVVAMEIQKSSNTSNLAEKVTAFFGKLFNPKEYEAADYDISTYSDASGAELWTMLERAVSEGNVKRTLYVTPEQKDTQYKYVYETTDGELNYRWDVEVTMSNKAGGQNVTDVNITKTTSVVDGFTDEIDLTHMSGSVGDTVLDPIDNYRAPAGDIDHDNRSILSAAEGAYIFEADGETEIYSDGTGPEDNLFTFAEDTQIDMSQYCPDRYMVPNYLYYELTKDDIKTEERVVGTHQEIDQPGVDLNGDGDFVDPGETEPTYKEVEDKVTKTIFEWNHDCELFTTPTEGGRAIIKGETEGTCKTAVKGEWKDGEYTELANPFTFADTDEAGNPVTEYTIPDGWTVVPFTGDAEKDPHYIIITQVDAATGETVYRGLLNDMISWQVCQMDGNFVKAVVQVYKVKYVQEAGDPNGFTVNWDGFSLGANVDQATGTATTNITKQADPMTGEVIDVGLGYAYENQGQQITFHTVPITAPIYFKTSSGIIMDMIFKGGVAYSTITMPEHAIDYLYEKVVPTLDFAQVGADGESYVKNLDWYNDLTPEDPEKVFDIDDGLPDGVRVTATRADSTAAGGEVMYTLQIITNQTEDHPLSITFADGYNAKIYTATAASGNGVGIIDMSNVYKTTRYTATDLIEIITTGADGMAESGLLPLGNYIVRELRADENYVNANEDQLVELKYKDQFTPIIWSDTKFDNAYMSVQLDLGKVFETAFKADQYQPPKDGQKVTFGLYAGENMTAKASGKPDVSIKTIEKDTLVDVITITGENGGIVAVDQKLPEGNYYLKEIDAPEDYIMSGLKYHFVVREDDGDDSADTTFDYQEDDGIFGKFVMEEKGHVNTHIAVEKRFPMPQITIDGQSYNLTEDFENEYIKIDADKDYTEIFVETFKEKATDITLPNGKALKVVASDNTFDYTVDGKSHTFIPTATYTGYCASYEELWTRVKGEDLTTYTPEFTLTGAGSDKDAVILKAAITHTPSVSVTTEEQLVDPAKPELGYEKVDVESGNLTESGYQIFEHSAVITVKDSADANVIAGTYTRTSSGKTAVENLPDSGEIVLNPKDTLTLNTVSGAVVTVSMDKYGMVSAMIEHTLMDFFTDNSNPAVTSTGKHGTGTFAFAKDVTLARQDTSADKLMIKVNSDNQDAFAIENDHQPLVKIKKVDKDDHAKTLSGAIFEIYTAKPSGEWTVEPDQLLGTYTTGADGTLDMTLGYGVYFYREISAPAGYTPDTAYHKFRVVKGEDPYVITVENVKETTPDGPGPSGNRYLLEISKQDMETGVTLAGAEFEIYGSHKDEKGNYVRNDKPLFDKPLVTGEYGKITVELTTSGIYYYHETKAPAGYKCDGEYYAVEVKNGIVVTKVTMDNERNKEPEIRTTAVDRQTRDHISYADGKVTIIDTVTYENLKPGTKYLMTGKLMDQKTGKVLKVNGKEVTSEKTFTPKNENGTVEMTFTFNAKGLEGTSTVVFEKVFAYVDKNGDGTPDKPNPDKDKPTATHEDITDEGQTVTITGKTPLIRTTAEGANGLSTMTPSKNAVIVDAVAYYNLIPGKSYTMKGILMDKKTGEPLLVDGKEVTASKTFVPEKANGYVYLKFTFDAIGKGNFDTVVFERCYDASGNLVAKHTDINDESQTVSIVTPSVVPRTGDNSPLEIYMMIMMISLAALVLLLAYSRRQKAAEKK